ncbi:MAG: transcription termination factor NusA [Candidatus Omnitrophica bacterium]|nr:transcription termination factor NusA [Candidatus Omnitrophota bacterium]MDD4012576.1 transcription termination factor NusA [Candidatus Omnitrophota bacterium]
MNGELLSALERLEREKGISKEVLFGAIESALISAARKVVDDPDVEKEDITVKINKDTGEIKIYNDGVEVKSDKFGRIAAQTAKQVIIQKIREAERDVVHDKYLDKVGTIVSGAVHRFEKGNTIVEADEAEAVLPKTEQIPRERFRQGESIRALLLKVEKGVSGLEIILSRADSLFVKKLFELEVPEISQGIVEIKAIAREPGERTKIAVHSKEEKVDAVGACVGMRGSRVRDIVRELHGERIDIVRWNSDIREYLKAAVSPAKITRMVIDRDNRTIRMTLPADQLSLVIGKKGRNIRLASKLLDWELIAESAEEKKDRLIGEIEDITEKSRDILMAAGYDTAEKVKLAGIEALTALNGIGPKTAEKIMSACDAALKAVAHGPHEDGTQEELPASQEAKGDNTVLRAFSSEEEGIIPEVIPEGEDDKDKSEAADKGSGA